MSRILWSKIWIVQNNTRQNNLFLNTYNFCLVGFILFSTWGYFMFIHACTLCNLYVCSQNTIYVQSYIGMQIYIYIYVLYTFYTKLECVHVTYTCIFIHRCRRGEHCMILWPQYLTGSWSIASDRCPATSALPWGRRVATWWTKSVPSGKWMLQDSKKQEFCYKPT